MRRLIPFIALVTLIAGCGTTTTKKAETPIPVSTCNYETLAGCTPVPTHCVYQHDGATVLPDPACTPGALYGPSQVDPASTVCVSGFTAKIRPPVSYTGPLKLKIMEAYGVTEPAKYELDHLVALEDGGAPADPRNLWPQPYSPTPGSHEKDDLENYEKRLVCAGSTTVAAAGEALAHDWLTTYEAVKPPHETFGRGLAP
jgi:hypothetical protein